MITIVSPHNPRLKELRRLARRRERERSGRFVAEGEDLIAAAARAGWPALDGLPRWPAAGSAATDFLDVEPAVLAEVSTLGSGTRVIGVYEQRWRRAARGRCASICTASPTPATSARCCARRTRSAPPASRSAPAARTRTRRRRCARAWARSSPCRSRASVDSQALPGERIALVAHSGRAAARHRGARAR